MGTYAEAWQNSPPTNKFLYVGGLQFSLLKNMLNFYAPLFYSSDFSNQLKTVPGANGFWQKISFSIDIQNFSLRKVFGNIPSDMKAHDHIDPHNTPAHNIPEYGPSRYEIHYLQRQEIDTAKWDACIDKAPNGLIYGRSFYLDHMAAGQWDALVLGDYEAIMPLAWRRKWGIRYLYQPPFTQQLGIFSGAETSPTSTSVSAETSPASTSGVPIITSITASTITSPLSASLANAFLHHLDRHFRFAEIFLNYGNPTPYFPPYTNYILDLGAPYHRLAGQYKKDLVRNLRLASRSSLHYIKEFDLTTALSLYKDRYQDRTPHLKEEAYTRFAALCQSLHGKGQLLVKAITDTQQRPLATAILPRDKGRIYLVQSTSLPEGRQAEANHFLLDRLIAEYAGQPMILDFEGSDLPGVAHFYRNFGAQDQPYFFYRRNRLPWPLRLLKR